MTPENRERLKTALLAIENAFEDEHDASCALEFINPAVQSSGSEDTQYVVVKILSAMSTAMYFLNDEVDLTGNDRTGFGYVLECCAQALFVNVTREEIRREGNTRPRVRAIGGGAK